MAKTYTVVKDGIELKELKTLPAAKKLADAEGAEVVCDGEVVYVPNLADVSPNAESAGETELEETSDQYTLAARMNVRKEPSLNAPKLKVLEKGAVVDVASIENDWLCLTDGSFILYGGGKYAKKN